MSAVRGRAAFLIIGRTLAQRKGMIMGKMDRVELLAPAGNMEGLYGAIHAGADAVYLGGNRFGARAYAENFTSEELVRCIRYAHLMGRKVYLTVNTLLKEQEMNELYDYLRPFYEAELDAVIVQDPGVLRLVRESFPGLKIHASTQMTLCSAHGVSLLKEMGASRVVPARELGLQEILLLKGRTSENPGGGPGRPFGEEGCPVQNEAGDMEVECFIHGAMCYCYSGQCLFSSILGGRSGNRGRCAQPCRLPYTLKTDGRRLENCYPLSLKDMCTIEHIPKLIEAGIDSFKIEGRMKKPEYAAGVTQVYRRYIDKYYELREKRGAEDAALAYKVEKSDWKMLQSLYIRSQVQDGYYFKRNGRDMVTLDNPAYSGSDESLLTEIRKKYIDAPLKIPVKVKAELRTGQPARLLFSVASGKSGGGRMNGVFYAVTGRVVERAQNRPISEEDVSARIGRLGESIFEGVKIEVSLDGDGFYPVGQINELRREAVSGLEEKILRARGYGNRSFSGNSMEQMPDERLEDGGRTDKIGGYVISVAGLEQLEEAAAWMQAYGGEEIRRIYVDADLIEEKWDKVSSLCRKLSDLADVYAALPYILRAQDEGYLENVCKKAEESGIFKGFLVRSLDGLGYVQRRRKCSAKAGEDGKMICRADAGVYAWNRFARTELGADGFCLPYELNASEQKRMQGEASWEKVVYGRIPMMVSANCLRRTAGLCGGVRKSAAGGENAAAGGDGRTCTGRKQASDLHVATLQDRYRKDFPVLVNCLHCMNVIYNSIPLSLHRETEKWKGRADLRIDFTLETPEEVKTVLNVFLKGDSFTQGEYTSGHEKRGVE